MSKPIEIPKIGDRYGNWTIIEDKVFRSGKKNRDLYWNVKCDCGNEYHRLIWHLKSGRTKHCKSCARTKNSTEENYLNKVERSAKRRGLDFNLTIEYTNSIFNGKCNLSNMPIEFGKYLISNQKIQTASLDRIDNKKGYIIGNVQWVHKDVNFMKGILTQERFIELCNNISNNKS